MIRLLIKLCILLGISYGVCAWKDCAGIPFCSEFRNQQLGSGDQYQADVSQFKESDNVITIPLSNSNGGGLQLEISFLSNDTARIKVLEVNNERYELEDVLETEPQTSSYAISDQDSDGITFNAKEGTAKIIVKKGPPFSIQFYYGDDLQVIFNASRFAMRNTGEDEAFHFDVDFEGAKGLVGLHHHAHKLILSKTADGSMNPFRLRNSDAAGFQVGSPMGLYGAVPVVYGLRGSTSSGVFLHNAAQQWVDIDYQSSSASAHFMAESGALDLFIMLGPTVKDLVRQLTGLVGKAHMPQYWTLGYHQCRYSYQSQDDVKSVIANMTSADFPMDAIWLDIDYTDQKKYFTWNPETFSDPKGMQEYIASTNRKLVTIIDPHIKVEEGYSVYDGAKGVYFIKNAEGTADYTANCWPGSSSWIDFLNPKARDYWVTLYKYENFNGSTPTLAGTWNDMNEPAVFNADDSEASAPGDTLHVNGVKHRAIHNAYGFLQSKASHEALLQRDGGKVRPFVLTRSHFAGSQRYAAMWTGDNRADNQYLAITYSECMLSNILGHVFCGADIGGFEGNPPDNLLIRWYQAGVWIPFYRGHSNSNTNRREPYLFSESVQESIRKAMRVRYRHIHVFYTLFYLHATTGDPIIRPLFYDYPEMLDYDGEILVGTDILGIPVLQQDDTSVQGIFPGSSSEIWYRADQDDWSVHYGGKTETLQADITTSPYFYRGGSVVVLRDTPRPSTTDMLSDSFTVYVNLNSSGQSEGIFYDDDHTSFDYANGQHFLIKLKGTAGEVTIESVDGSLPITFPIERIITHSVSLEDPRKAVKRVHEKTADGTPLRDINIGHMLKNTKGASPNIVTLKLDS